MAATHFAARFEDGFNRRLIPFLRQRGWRPRTIGYNGYGSTDFVRVLGRVVMGRRVHAEEQVDRAATTEELARAVFNQRGWRSYITAPVAYIPVTVQVGGRHYHTRTDRSGYIDLTIRNHGLEPGWHDVVVLTKAALPVTAPVLVVDDDAPLGIVSDIDDTVMVTSIPRPLVAAWHTFIRHVRARQLVPGMAQMYRDLTTDYGGVPVFYLSTGAWNLMPALNHVLQRGGYPQGPMLMTDWGPTNTGWFRSGQEHKHNTLRRLRAEFPTMKWVLIGDDGQHDPTIYREFAAEFPDSVAAIAIRELSPTEQFLSHGSPTASVGTFWTPPSTSTPEVHGVDGVSIAPRLRAVLRAFL